MERFIIEANKIVEWLNTSMDPWWRAHPHPAAFIVRSPAVHPRRTTAHLASPPAPHGAPVDFYGADTSLHPLVAADHDW